MTTIISRHYADAKTAQGVVDALGAAGFPADTVTMISSADTDAMMEARVSQKAATGYAEAMTAKSTLVVVAAPFTPFGAALKAMKIVDSAPSHSLAGVDENRYIAEQPRTDLYLNNSILRDHPRFLSSDMNPRANANRSTVSKAFSLPTLTKHRTTRSASRKGHIFPMKLLSTKARSISAISGGKRMMYNPF